MKKCSVALVEAGDTMMTLSHSLVLALCLSVCLSVSLTHLFVCLYISRSSIKDAIALSLSLSLLHTIRIDTHWILGDLVLSLSCVLEVVLVVVVVDEKMRGEKRH